MSLRGWRRHRWKAAGAAALLLGLALFAWRLPSPLEVVQEYVRQSYAGNYRAVYPLLSARDRAGLDAGEYALQQGALKGGSLQLARELAASIRFSEVEVEGSGSRLVLRVKVSVPDGNHPAVREILFHSGRAGDFSPQELERRQAALRRMAGEGFPGWLESRETFILVREGLWWRIREGLDEGVAVRLEAGVAGGLPVEFEPLTDLVRVDPGGMARAAFRLRNTGTERLEVKARERILPGPQALVSVQCFCSLKIELGPGEEKELPVAFYLPPDSTAGEIRLSYVLYPAAAFPAAWPGGDHPPRAAQP